MGNWLEAEEAILLCSGQVGAAPDVAHLAVHQAAQLLLLADHPACCGNNGSSKLEAAVEAAAAALEAGEALPYLRRMVQAQGGDVSANVVWGDCRCLLSLSLCVCVLLFLFLFFSFFFFRFFFVYIGAFSDFPFLETSNCSLSLPLTPLFFPSLDVRLGWLMRWPHFRSR